MGNNSNEFCFSKERRKNLMMSNFWIIGITLGLDEELCGACLERVVAEYPDLWCSQDAVLIERLVSRAAADLVEWIDAASKIGSVRSDQGVLAEDLKKAYYDLYDETLTGDVWDDVSVEQH